MGKGTAEQQDLLTAARSGDEAAYARIVEAHRGELHAHCYRMLGSVHDAEDALQDALLRAWRALPSFEGRSSLRTWLYRVATNASLDLAERRRRRVLPVDHGPPSDAHDGPGQPLVESVWVEPYPDDVLGMEDGHGSPAARYERRESIELAFVAALQHLPARQRAALILCEVLGFSARETAQTLDTTVASVNSALQRARAAVQERLPERSQQQALRTLGDEGLRALVEGYADAWERGDVDAIVAMLADDAVLAMPPMATWYRGDDVVVFLTDWAFSGRVYDAEGDRRVRVFPIRASGQPAFAVYRWDGERGAYVPGVLQVLTLAGDGRVAEICGFVGPRMFPRFGLPLELGGRSDEFPASDPSGSV